MEGYGVVFVVGGPGSGKGVQCEKIKAAYPLRHVSVGDLMRAEAGKGSKLGRQISKAMKKGELLSLEVTNKMLRNHMEEEGPGWYLVDGFPRTLEQLEQFEKDVTPCTFALFFNTSEATMEQRLLGRGRGDDNADTIKARFQTFKKQSMPAIESLREMGKLREISADGTPDAVFAAVRRVFKKDFTGAPKKSEDGCSSLLSCCFGG